MMYLVKSTNESIDLDKTYLLETPEDLETIAKTILSNILGKIRDVTQKKYSDRITIEFEIEYDIESGEYFETALDISQVYPLDLKHLLDEIEI